jgi:hypothetical protein
MAITRTKTVTDEVIAVELGDQLNVEIVAGGTVVAKLTTDEAAQFAREIQDIVIEADDINNEEATA